VEALFKTGLRLWQGFAGENTLLERVLRRHYKTVCSRIDKEIVGENYVIFWTRYQEGKRVGIYVKGDCQLQAIFACKPMIRRTLDGTCCIFNDGEVAGSRSDFILQTLSDKPEECLDQISAKLKIPKDYFRPRLFERTLSVPGPPGHEGFPKSVVFLSTGSDFIRTMYRHRETGILVDPGGWWLTQPMERVLDDLSSVRWFRENFENIGRIELQTFANNYEKIIDLVRKRTGAHVVVFNIPTVEPRKLVHNYQFVQRPLVKRTREFNVALAELSRKLDFPIIDIDRIVKKAGIREQKDSWHFSPDLTPVVAEEVVGAMRDLKIF